MRVTEIRAWIRGRSLSDVLNNSTVQLARRGVLRRLMPKVAGLHGNGSVQRISIDTMCAHAHPRPRVGVPLCCPR